MSEPPAAAESQFRIEAGEGPREPRTRVLKHGNTFAVLSDFGDIGRDRGCVDGLYHRDTRFLSQLEVKLNGVRPLLLSSTAAKEDTILPVDLANSDTIGYDGRPLQRELIYLNRRQFVWESTLWELLLVRNFDLRRHKIILSILFSADFADVFEVRGQVRARRGTYRPALVLGDRVVLRYRGLDELEYATALSFWPTPRQLEARSAHFALELGPSEWCRLALRIACARGTADKIDRQDWNVRQFYRALRSERRELRNAKSRAVAMSASNPLFNELAQRAVSDIYILNTDTENGPYPYAGIPWFSTPFGRDGIITALLTLWLDPMIANGVLRFLAATQATAVDPEQDAEPGKILHETRDGEMAHLLEVPFGRYYGSVDSTPLFIMLLGEYYARTNDLSLVRLLWPNIAAALRWVDTYGDRDGDGLVEYDRQTDTGLVNQGWKDSTDSISHADGRLATGPIALCEVQAYVFGAKRHAAMLAHALGDTRTAARLAGEAEALRLKVEDAFWCEELSTYALALDGAKQQCRVVSSNAGHLLLTGLAEPKRAKRVAETLMSAACFSGWGIRTLARTAVRYNPISYHNGSVWPHDNALLALGFARYDLKEPILRVFAGLYDAVCHWEPRRLPELFCGFARRGMAPTMYPVACSPQAWSSAAVFGLLQASLGLSLDAAAGEIRFRRPRLPAFLPDLHLRGLRLDDAGADVLLQRHGREVTVTVTHRQGTTPVVIVH